MNEQTLDNSEPKSVDNTTIGWRVQGRVSSQEQYTIHLHAVLHCEQVVQKFGRQADDRHRSAESERYSIELSPHHLPTSRSKLNSNLDDISIARAMGQTGEDIREMSDLLWNEICISGEWGGNFSEAGIRIRISDDIDPSWAQSLLYDADDKLSIDRDVLISRPIISDASGTLSMVISHSVLGVSSNAMEAGTNPAPQKHTNHRAWCFAGERRASTDIGFCTIEVKLLSPEHLEVNSLSALHFLDPRRNLPVSEESVGVRFNIMSLYLHPSYRKRGLGRLLAGLIKTFISFIVDELVEQIAYRDYIRNVQTHEHVYVSRGSTSARPRSSALDIVVCGTSVDQRSDRVFRTILGGVLAEFGGDGLSPASADRIGDASRLRSFALVCDSLIARGPGHHESQVLISLLRKLGEVNSFHSPRKRSSPWGNVTTTVVDLVDWRADR